MKCKIIYKTISIEPPYSNYKLSGFGNRQKDTSTLGIKESKLRILIIKFDDIKLLFISMDTLYFSNKIQQLIEADIVEKLNINSSNIIYTATHTHSGLQFDFFKYEILDDKYIKMFLNKFETMINTISDKDFIDVAMYSYTIGLDDNITVNRRKYTYSIKKFFKKDTLMLANYEKKVYDDINGLAFYKNNQLEYMMISYACHPVFNTNNTISSDYPGAIIHKLQEKNIIKDAMFVQGFSGDLRANYIDKINKKSTMNKFFKMMIYKNTFRNYSKNDFNNFVDTIVHSIELKLNASRTEVNSERIEIQSKKFLLNSVTKKTSKDLFVKIIKLNNKLSILILSAEVFSNYYNALKNKKHIIPISCTNNCIGYLPSSEELEYGGYEINGSAKNNGLDSKLGTQDIKSLEKYLLDNI